MSELGTAQNLRYEISAGIRKPRKGAARSVKGHRVRGVVYELEDAGGIQLWHCGHDHAPGVRDMRQISDAQRENAYQCAEVWIATQIELGRLDRLPVVREA